MPVPKDYAQKYDKGKTVDLRRAPGVHRPLHDRRRGQRHRAELGYAPGRLIVLVRNPSWDKSTDFQPAYFDKITITSGSDATVAARQILTGQSLMSGDCGRAADPDPEVRR